VFIGGQFVCVVQNQYLSEEWLATDEHR
jgi:hypothetical protein